MERFIRLNRSILDCDLAKLETHFPIAVHWLHTPLLYVRRSLTGLWERVPPRAPPRRYDRSSAPEWTQRAAADFLGITPRALRHYKTHPPDCHWPGWEDPIRLAQWKNQREDADRLARALRSAVPYREGPTEMQSAACKSVELRLSPRLCYNRGTENEIGGWK